MGSFGNKLWRLRILKTLGPEWIDAAPGRLRRGVAAGRAARRRPTRTSRTASTSPSA